MSNSIDLKQDLIYIPESIDNPPSKFGLKEGNVLAARMSGGHFEKIQKIYWYDGEVFPFPSQYNTWLRPVPRLTWEREIASNSWDAAVSMTLKRLAQTFLNPSNQNEADKTSDKEVFQAIGETITNFPMPESDKDSYLSEFIIQTKNQ